MSVQNEIDESMMGTRPLEEHAWLQNLVGEWHTESEMQMGPGGDVRTSTGSESVICLGGLWAFAEGKTNMAADGPCMEYKVALGYDVSFKEYRGCWFASMSSHLWKYTGELSSDKKIMTLNCVGPNMVVDGETSLYRDVIELIDENHRTMTSYGQGEDGEFHQFMKVRYTRI